jgi:hypothetical protein
MIQTLCSFMVFFLMNSFSFLVFYNFLLHTLVIGIFLFIFMYVMFGSSSFFSRILIFWMKFCVFFSFFLFNIFVEPFYELTFVQCVLLFDFLFNKIVLMNF